MSATNTFSWESPGDWHLNLRHMGASFVSGTSSGKLAAYSLEKQSRQPLQVNAHAHEGAINQIEKVDEHVVCSVSSDGLKVWDLRASLGQSQLTLQNAKKSKFLSVAYRPQGGVVAGGTELVGVDAEVHLWDLKKASQPVQSYVDSHHDDVTYLEFHGTRDYLMSGSTDGYVNVYNLGEPDEDEALHQVVNFASVHQCTFLQPHRIGVLSHMETFGVFELNNTDYESVAEPQPHVWGDVRGLWPNCEYVIHVTPSHVAYGANSASSLTVVPFDAVSESVRLDLAVTFPGAHGGEVVRDLMVLSGDVVLSCGEDGLIKAWDAKLQLSADKEGKREEKREKREKKEKKERKENEKKENEKKERKERKEKKDRRNDRKDKKDKVRFKPY